MRLVIYILLTDYPWDWLKIPEQMDTKARLYRIPVNTLSYFSHSLEGKKKLAFSHWWKSISHWGKTETHKGKVIFYLCLQKTKTTYQNILFTSKFSLGLLLDHCFTPLLLSAKTSALCVNFRWWKFLLQMASLGPAECTCRNHFPNVFFPLGNTSMLGSKTIKLLRKLPEQVDLNTCSVHVGSL